MDKNTGNEMQSQRSTGSRTPAAASASRISLEDFFYVATLGTLRAIDARKAELPGESKYVPWIWMGIVASQVLPHELPGSGPGGITGGIGGLAGGGNG